MLWFLHNTWVTIKKNGLQSKHKAIALQLQTEFESETQLRSSSNLSRSIQTGSKAKKNQSMTSHHISMPHLSTSAQPQARLTHIRPLQWNDSSSAQYVHKSFISEKRQQISNTRAKEEDQHSAAEVQGAC